MKAVLNLQHNIASEGLERILSWEGGTVIFLHVYTCIIIYNIVAIIFWWGGGISRACPLATVQIHGTTQNSNLLGL